MNNLVETYKIQQFGQKEIKSASLGIPKEALTRPPLKDGFEILVRLICVARTTQILCSS